MVGKNFLAVNVHVFVNSANHCISFRVFLPGTIVMPEPLDPSLAADNVDNENVKSC